MGRSANERDDKNEIHERDCKDNETGTRMSRIVGREQMSEQLKIKINATKMTISTISSVRVER